MRKICWEILVWCYLGKYFRWKERAEDRGYSVCVFGVFEEDEEYSMIGVEWVKEVVDEV